MAEAQLSLYLDDGEAFRAIVDACARSIEHRLAQGNLSRVPGLSQLAFAAAYCLQGYPRPRAASVASRPGAGGLYVPVTRKVSAKNDTPDPEKGIR
jgi:hypothetical protein